MSLTNDTILRCRSISKAFKGVRALEGVDFDIHRGKVHGLIGENGAGKSTLMKILSGAYTADSGEVAIEGEPVHVRDTQDAIDRGIVTIYQDSDLIPTLSVAENIYLNHEPLRGSTPLIDRERLQARTRELLGAFNLDVSPAAKVRDLPNDIQKMIQIIKAVSRDAKVLLMDEPTSALTRHEVDIILGFVRSLAAQGVGVVFISHYLAEVFRVCDLITILREGRVVRTVDTRDTSLAEAIRLMIGRTIADEQPPSTPGTERERFAVHNLNVRRRLKDISLAVGEGEILGVTGLIGSGTAELAKALFRSEDVHWESGEVLLEGRAVRLRNTEDAIRHRIGFLPNDRKNEGLFARFSVADNICLSSLGKYVGPLRLLRPGRMAEDAQRYIEALAIKTPGPLVPVENLSGGNQQKVLLAKWLDTDPLVLILNEPTVGIDVGTKFEIRKLIRGIAARGVSVILVTTELEELEKLCHRVLVMFRGEIVKELRGGEIQKESILAASTGGN